MPTNHFCAAENCQIKIDRGKLMCISHWRSLPVNMQESVNETWRKFNKEGSKENLRKYMEARRAAVAFVRERESRQPVVVQ